MHQRTKSVECAKFNGPQPLEPRHVISNNGVFLISVDSDEPLQSPVELRNSKFVWSVA